MICTRRFVDLHDGFATNILLNATKMITKTGKFDLPAKEEGLDPGRENV